jgi:hypothetical protein
MVHGLTRAERPFGLVQAWDHRIRIQCRSKRTMLAGATAMVLWDHAAQARRPPSAPASLVARPQRPRPSSSFSCRCSAKPSSPGSCTSSTRHAEPGCGARARYSGDVGEELDGVILRRQQIGEARASNSRWLTHPSRKFQLPKRQRKRDHP